VTDAAYLHMYEVGFCSRVRVVVNVLVHLRLYILPHSMSSGLRVRLLFGELRIRHPLSDCQSWDYATGPSTLQNKTCVQYAWHMLWSCGDGREGVACTTGCELDQLWHKPGASSGNNEFNVPARFLSEHHFWLVALHRASGPAYVAETCVDFGPLWAAMPVSLVTCMNVGPR